MLAATVLALFAAASVNAISITSPAKDADTATFKAGVATTVEWTSVNTDPDSFDIVVQIPSPFSTKTIAEDVETSAGSYSFTPDASLVGGGEYVINFIDPKTNGILVQSGKFEVEQGNAVASSAASGAASSAATSKAAASGVTSVASPSGSAAANASGASGNSTAAIPNASATPAGSGANALVPSLALVGAAVVAAVL